jgi:hypothetical protein
MFVHIHIELNSLRVFQQLLHRALLMYRMNCQFVRDTWPLVFPRSLTHVKTHLHSSSRYILHTLLLRRSSSLRQETMAVRRTAAFQTVPWLPLVQRTFCGIFSTTRLMLTCRYQVTCARRIRCIPLRRGSRCLNQLQFLHTQQGTVPLKGLALQLQRPIHTTNSLWR